jgi:capsular polysaccharide biosynthesis protein
VRSRETGTPHRVAIPPLGLGAGMLARLPCAQPIPDVAEYLSVTPWSCTFRDAALHGPRGIVRLGDTVVADTLPGQDAGGEQHRAEGARVRLRTKGFRRLPGRTLSLISGGEHNYWHWTVDALGRLAADPDVVRGCDYVLTAPLIRPYQRAGLALAGIAPERVVELATGDAVDAEELVVPWSIHADFRAHRSLRAFFATLGATVPRGEATPKRLYLERDTKIRPLLNEAEVVAALAPLGFVAVRLERFALPEQIALLRGADCVVAPHGAALTNLLFAPAGAAVLELHLNTYVHWCYRRIAALAGMRYDCVIGRRAGGPDDNVHAQSWVVSPMHVAAAADELLRR